MADTQYMNQFGQLPLKGQVSFIVNPNTLSVRLYYSSAYTLVPGDMVKLYSTAGNEIMVEKAAQGDTPFGTVLYSPKIDKWTGGMMMEIGLPGTIVTLQAGAGISRGSDLQNTPTAAAPKVITNAGSYPIVGIALEPASADGDLIRVLLKGSIALASTITSGTINGAPIGQTTPAAGTFTTLNATAITGGAVVNLGSSGGTISMDPTLGNLFKLTPTAAVTFNAASVPATAQRISLLVLVTAAGQTSFNITFNTNFRMTGVLATGTSIGMRFLVSFVSDGTAWTEVSRTAAY